MVGQDGVGVAIPLRLGFDVGSVEKGGKESTPSIL
jgi:hypothetical protein